MGKLDKKINFRKARNLSSDQIFCAKHPSPDKPGIGTSLKEIFITPSHPSLTPCPCISLLSIKSKVLKNCFLRREQRNERKAEQMHQRQRQNPHHSIEDRIKIHLEIRGLLQIHSER